MDSLAVWIAVVIVAVMCLVAIRIENRAALCKKRGHGTLREVDSGIQCTHCGMILDD